MTPKTGTSEIKNRDSNNDSNSDFISPKYTGIFFHAGSKIGMDHRVRAYCKVFPPIALFYSYNKISFHFLSYLFGIFLWKNVPIFILSDIFRFDNHAFCFLYHNLFQSTKDFLYNRQVHVHIAFLLSERLRFLYSCPILTLQS